MEQWNLDAVSKGKIQELFMICEIEFQRDFFSDGPMPGAVQAMQIIDGTSPIIHYPNDNIRISSITDYWTDKYMAWSWDVFDYGDLIQLPINSKSKIILGSKSGDDNKNGTLVSCLNNRVILWTSSTHNYTYNRILPLWQNMIYHALKARYDNLNPPAAQ